MSQIVRYRGEDDASAGTRIVYDDSEIEAKNRMQTYSFPSLKSLASTTCSAQLCGAWTDPQGKKCGVIAYLCSDGTFMVHVQRRRLRFNQALDSALLNVEP